MCDYWPTENVWSWVKRALIKKVSKNRAFKKGVGTHAAIQQREREAHSEAMASVALPVPKSRICRCTTGDTEGEGHQVYCE